MDPSEHERREDTRKRAPVELYVEYPDYNQRIRDLSLNGAFIEDVRPLKPGRVVRILITDRKNPPLEMQAMVRRVIPNQGMTVEFVGMSDETRRRLRALVDVEMKTEEKLL